MNKNGEIAMASKENPSVNKNCPVSATIRLIGGKYKALEGVAGVTAVTVSLEDKQAVVEGTATDEALTAAIVDAGYEVKGIE